MSPRRFALLLTACFALVTAVGLFHHEMWRDELQAFAIARDSQSLQQMFATIRYQGHPALWYLLLRGLCLLWRNPLGMQLLHLGITTSAIFVFARNAPFTCTQKVLFAFGYYPLFEYNLISRDYGLSMLLLFLACLVLSAPGRRRLGLAMLCCLLANLNVYSLIVAVGLFAASLCDRDRKDLLPAGLLFLAALGIAVAQVLPPPDIHPFATKWHPGPEPGRLVAVLGGICKAYVRIPDFRLASWWTWDLLTGTNPAPGAVLPYLVALPILGLCLFGLRRHPAALLLYLIATLGILAFSYLKLLGFVRHYGYFYLVFIAALWLAGPSRPRFLTLFLDIVLCIHLVSGVTAYGVDLVRPFSQSLAVVRYLRQHGLQGMPIIGSHDFSMVPLSAWLDRPIYHPESGTADTYVIVDNRHHYLPPGELLQQAQSYAQRLRQPVLLISTSPVPGVLPLAEFTGSIVNRENYHLYLVRPEL